jgi:CBS domain-containing protein/Zn-dependent protease
MSSSRPASASRLVGLPLGRWLGIEIVASWSLLALTLAALALCAAVLPRWLPEWSAVMTWGVAVAAALGLLASVLVHALARALMARALGHPVRRVVPLKLSELTHLDDGEGHSPAADLMLAVAAPLTSACLGVFALALGLAGPGLGNEAGELASLGPTPLLASWLGVSNIALALAALTPAFPLDGGRVVRSALWAATGDLTRATRWAVRAGRTLALLAVLCGMFSVVHGAFAVGLWLALSGWFLNRASRQSYERVWWREAWKNMPLERVMRTDVVRVDRDLTVEEFVCGYLTRTRQRAFPVEDHGRLLGMLRLADVRKLPQREWTRTRAVQLMRRVDEVLALPPDAPAHEALDALTQRNLDQLPVVDRDHVVGVVNRSDLLQWLQSGEEQGRSPRSALRYAHAAY